MASTTLLALASWVCAETGFLCVAPDMSVIQRAYQNESAAGSALHDRGLRILSAQCGRGNAAGYLCEVTFASASDPDARLYFDVVRVVRAERGWQLASGLCKR
jgi:hypothetical protein